ncbi:MAG: hypothetical protein Q9M50_15145 [Methylococcales bacterium]|nr:hypothetical protein [Methylococcales bacterium]
MKPNPLSQQAVNQAVLANSLQHPFVLYSAVAGVLAIASGVVFNLGSLPLIASSTLTVISIGNWFFQFFARRDVYFHAYFSKVHARLKREKKQKLTKLKKELQQVDSIYFKFQGKTNIRPANFALFER